MDNINLVKHRYQGYDTFMLIYKNHELVLDRLLYAWYVSYLENDTEITRNILLTVWAEILSECLTYLTQYFSVNQLRKTTLIAEPNALILLSTFTEILNKMEYKIDTRLIKEVTIYETTE